MVNLLDQIFLRLLGYSGPYVDYSTIIPGPLRKGVVTGSGTQTNS